MDSTQIIKRRLAELKRMSIQLKQSTQNSKQVDYNIVYSIIEATKSSASKLSQPKDSESKLSIRSQSPLSRLLSMNSSPQPYKALFPQTTQQRKSKNNSNLPTHPNLKSKTSPYNQTHHPQPHQNTFYHHSQQQPYNYYNYNQPHQEQFIGTINNHQQHQQQHNPQQQVLTLRQQNANLQKSMLSMRHQIHQLKDKLETLTKEQEWKAGLPYFKLDQNISAFYTRMKINQNDYSKIDYVPYHAELNLDKLIVKKISGTTTPKQIELSQLREVQYVDSIVMFLHFGVVQNQKGRNSANRDESKLEKNSTEDFFENLFIKFNNQEELHRWDLALYINFKIMDSLKKDKLFQSYSRSRSKSRKRSSQSKYYDSHKKSKRSSDNIIEDDQDLMKKLIERRELYQETKRLVSERMIEKVNEKKIIRNQSVGKKHQKDQGWYEDAEQFSQTHPFQIADEQLVSLKSKFNYVVRDQNGNEQTQGEKSQRANTSKFKDLMASGKINSVNGESVVIPGLNLSGATSLQNERGLSFNPGQHDLSLSRKLQQERIKQANQLKQQQQQKLKKIQQIIKKFTQQGYDLTKYSKDGFNPHDKRFFISSDMKQLCWEEEGAKNKKSIKLESIKEVMLEKIGEGIRKHIKKPKRQEHCIISYIKEGKMKVIQLGANSTVMAQFVDELITVIDHFKELNNN